VPWQEDSFPGLLSNVVAGRIANRLDLHGTNCTVDAACASSLAAVAAAANELALGQADLVVTGGVDATNNPLMYVCFSKTPALSPTGDARPFAEDADGTLLGEGLAMLGLKRLDAAERDGDRVYAVIRGLGTSSDGRGGPSTRRWPPGRCGHCGGRTRPPGTARTRWTWSRRTAPRPAPGTPPSSSRCAASSARRAGRTPDGARWAAVKSQIGHTKAAAGAAGLVKAVLALHQRTLPPTIKVREPNPGLGIEDSPFYLNTVARPWTRRASQPGGRRSPASASAAPTSTSPWRSTWPHRVHRPTRHPWPGPRPPNCCSSAAPRPRSSCGGQRKWQPACGPSPWRPRTHSGPSARPTPTGSP
jgi:3-oxoacyl-(acyl-carrier-protein) synthase